MQKATILKSNFLITVKIKDIYRIRQVAGESILMIVGRNPGDMTKVMAFNETALYLWDNLQGRDFEIADVVELLLQQYEIDDSTALKDATSWVQILREHSIVS